MRGIAVVLALLVLAGCDRAIYAAADFGGRTVLWGIDSLVDEPIFPASATDGDGRPLVAESDLSAVTSTEGYNPLAPNDPTP